MVAGDSLCGCVALEFQKHPSNSQCRTSSLLVIDLNIRMPNHDNTHVETYMNCCDRISMFDRPVHTTTYDEFYDQHTLTHQYDNNVFFVAKIFFFALIDKSLKDIHYTIMQKQQQEQENDNT